MFLYSFWIKSYLSALLEEDNLKSSQSLCCCIMVKNGWIYFVDSVCFQIHFDLRKLFFNSFFCSVRPRQIFSSYMISHIGVIFTVCAVNNHDNDFTIFQLNEIFRDFWEFSLMDSKTLYLLLNSYLSLLLINILSFYKLI